MTGSDFLEAFSPAEKLENEGFFLHLAVLAASFLALFALAGKFNFIVPGSVYPTVHMIMEFASILVAMSVSLMSWYDYRYKGESRVIILAAAFCAVGLVDFAHSLSYFGMPGFLTANSVNKASTYWILARMVQAAGILAALLAAGRRWEIRRPGLVLLISVAASVLAISVTALYLDRLPPMYDEISRAQTPLKILLEYLVMAVMLASAVLVMCKKQKDTGDYQLGAALLAGILGELSFTFYSSAYDSYNLLGHVFKVVSFAFILKALLEEALAGIYLANRELERRGRDLAEANRRLRMADKLKNDFLANTNHELRTPLSAIVAFTELMLDQENTGPLNHLQRDYMKEISDSCHGLQSKINGLLYLSGVLGGKVVLHLEEVNLGEIVAGAAGVLRKGFSQKGVSLKTVIGEECRVLGDREKIARILTNLLENALKFTDPGGRVEVIACSGPGKGEVSMKVADTGIGIEPLQREAIYEMFYQVDGASTRKYGGTGIGLTLAAKLVEMHGGRMELESEFGSGSRFTVILPAQA